MNESTKPFDGSTGEMIDKETGKHAEHLDAMWGDMEKALEQYNTHNPTTQAMTSNAGAVAKGVFEQLKASGFSLLDILPKMFAIVALIQKYGGDIMAIVNEFKQIFGVGSVPAPK